MTPGEGEGGRDRGEGPPGTAETAAAAAIAVAGLVKGFAGRPAVRGVSLRVPAGSIYCLHGPDGAGKTTLLRCLAGVLRPDAGDVRLAGVDPRREPDRARTVLGYLPQQFSLYPDLSVQENLDFFARLHGLSGEAWRERREELLAFAGLGEFRRRPAGDLSGGMRQKLALCCAVMHRPPVLLLDEPSLGVDPVSRHELWEVLRALRDGGGAVLLSTPYQDEAARGDRLGFLVDGRLALAGPPAELARGFPSLEDALVACLPGGAPAQVRPVPRP